MIRRLFYWLELSASNISPITSPTVSATQLATAAQPCVNQSKGEHVSDEIAPVSSKSEPSLVSEEHKEAEDSKGASALPSSGATSHASDSGIASDLTSVSSSSAHEVTGAANKDVQDTSTAISAAGPDASNKTSQDASTSSVQGTSAQGSEASAATPVPLPHSASSITAVFWKPEFPLLPGSRGFCLSMQKILPQLTKVLESHGINQ